MFVIKADGRKEKFEKRKIIRTCLRAGTSRKKAETIATGIKSRIRNNTTTHEIYKMILALLRKTEKLSPFFFRLREALAELDPLSFEFYTKKLLESYGYKCKWDTIIKGKCVEHQVDLIAEKDKFFLVEVKHHFNHHRFTGLGETLQVQARLEDVKDGFRTGKNIYDFKQAWIITNTKFSDHARRYAKAKNIILTGWGPRPGIGDLAKANKAFPVTILQTDKVNIKKLLNVKIITLQDLLKNEKRVSRLLGSKKAKSTINQASSLIL